MNHFLKILTLTLLYINLTNMIRTRRKVIYLEIFSNLCKNKNRIKSNKVSLTN